ncbi:efflux RND transporter permease subunit [Tautonia rosea]|uniref:efflux RND transporter permease subunit n=1 Tax=Tautonia rosea TaxID=2728037 RepID=UPI0014761C8A
MNALPEFAIRRPTIVLVVVLMTVVWGLVSFLTMPRREDPEFTIKVCVVSTSWPGAPAETVEELITDPLEEAIDSLEEVHLIRSTTTNGRSTIYVEIEERIPGDRIDDIWDKVRARVAEVPMPESGIRAVVNDQFGDTSVMLFAVHQVPLPGAEAIEPGRTYSPRQLDLFSEQVRDALRLLPGVATVDRFGVQEETIFIETDAGTWSRLGLTSAQLASLLRERNIEAPGGTIDTDDGRFFVKPGGAFDAVREIETMVVDVPGSGGSSRTLTLRDLGLEVRRGYVDPPLLLCRYGDSEPSTLAVIVAVTMKSGANILDLCDAARAKVRALTEVSGLLPPDVRVSIVSDQSVSVRGRIQGVIVNIISAIVIVVAVVYLVVGFRTAAVMAGNIPFVVLASLGIITLFEVQLEQMSLASMIIALGLLVDNAVQVCDQARSNQAAGMDPKEAAVSGAQLLAVPMLNGTLTTIAAFVPMLIAIEGANREFIYGLPVTLSVMLGVSWLLAMTLCVILAAAFIRVPSDPTRPSAPIPWLASRLFGRQNLESDGLGRFERGYIAFSRLALRFKGVTLAVVVGLLVLAVRLPVAAEFFPIAERDQFAVQVWLPESSTLEQTERIAGEVEELIRRLSPIEGPDGTTVDRLDGYRTLIGGGGSRWYLSWEPEAPKPYYAEILVRTTDGRWTHDFVEDLRIAAESGNEERGLSPIVGARVVPIELSLGPPADPVVLRVSGDGFANMADLRAAADRVKAIVEARPETWAVRDSWGVEGYQLRVDVDDDRARRSGVAHAQVAETLDAYYSGRPLTTFREGDHQVPVAFRLRPEGRRSLAGMDRAFVEGGAGKVPLSAVAKVSAAWEPASIDRRDLNRTIEIRARVVPGVSGNDVTQELFDSEEMEQLRSELPIGFRIEVGGALEESIEAQAMMLNSFGLSFVAIVLLLIAQFDSVSKAMIIIGTLPLAMIGALFGLWLTDNALGFMPQLGILALFGIVLNAGIIFMEFAEIVVRERAEQSTGDGPIAGLSVEEFRSAIIEAGRRRLMPIFLTTATTVGGLIPLALDGGPLWEGMAWLMIFGLLVATFLTLIVIPCLFALAVETLRLRPIRSVEPKADRTAITG